MNEKQNNMMLMGQLIEERHYSLLMSTCPITASFKVKLSQWACFSVRRFIYVYLFHTAYLLYYCEHNGMDMM